MVQDLVDSVYNVLAFKEEAKDYAVWDNLHPLSAWFSDSGPIDVIPAKKGPSTLEIGAEVARSIREAADTATTGSSGADALLHYMDADDVGAYVELEMRRKDKKNKITYLESKGSAEIDIDDEEGKAELQLLANNWPKLNPLRRLGRNYADSTPEDKAYWNSLKPWEQRYVWRSDCRVEKLENNHLYSYTPAASRPKDLRYDVRVQTRSCRCQGHNHLGT